MFQCMIFDVGDILYDATYWRRWLTSAINERGIPLTYEQLVVDWERLLVPVYTGHLPYWSQLDRLLSKYGLTQIEKEQLTSEARHQAQIAKDGRVPLPLVPETLARLHESKVVLVALSDNESGEKSVRETLQQLTIEPYFAAVLSSRDLGFAKPHPRAFDAAVRASSISQELCAFVGHDIDELEGAKHFGLSTIAYNHAPGATANFFIAQFDELLQYRWKP